MSKPLLKDMIKIEDVRKQSRFPRREEKVKVEVIYDKKKSRYLLWSVALVSAAFFFFALSFLFSKTEIKVNPKIKELVLNENLSANRDSNNNGLFFNLVVIQGEEKKIIQATGEKDVFEKATGIVMIYNAFSSSPQVLSIDTRLEGSNGKIYKTLTKTTVPGVDKKGIPGSVEVKIYASAAGADYNSPPLDFKLVGFKGTPKYSKIYARSKGEIISGFKGKVPAVSDANEASILADLKTTLEAKLLQKATDQIPVGLVLFKNAVFLNMDNTNIPPTFENNNLTIILKGTLYGLIFNEQKLTKKIAEDNIEKYDGSEVFISNIRDLVFSLTSQDNVSFGDMKSINFNLSGPAKIVWKLDENKFITDLLGKLKKDFNQILSQYPNIDSATLTLSPFWKRSISDQAKKIKVIVNYPK